MTSPGSGEPGTCLPVWGLAPGPLSRANRSEKKKLQGQGFKPILGLKPEISFFLKRFKHMKRFIHNLCMKRFIHVLFMFKYLKRFEALSYVKYGRFGSRFSSRYAVIFL